MCAVPPRHVRVTKVSFPPTLEGNVTKFPPQKALKLIAQGKLTFDGMIVHHRVDVYKIAIPYAVTLLRQLRIQQTAPRAIPPAATRERGRERESHPSAPLPPSQEKTTEIFNDFNLKAKA